MVALRSRFSFLRWPLQPLAEHVTGVHPKSKLAEHLGHARYSVRLLRYWWAGQALAEEARRLGRPLRVVDLGVERGWLKHFTPPEAVEHWTGVDWNPKPEAAAVAGYDELVHANADESLPLASQMADAVVSLHLLEHMPRPGAVLAEVSRLLHPGGIFLGGAPTMPGLLARWRERYFRSKLRGGKLTPGGHITVLSPGRWCRLAEEVGMEIEFAVGSHAVRMTGSRLENSKLWVRLNQLWGALFPSLGSECYLRARRLPLWDFAAQPLPRGDGRRRLLWAAAATVAVALMAVLGSRGVEAVARGRAHGEIDRWLATQQKGSDRFIAVADDNLPEHIAARNDVIIVQRIEDVEAELRKNNTAHVLVEKSDLGSLIDSGWADRLMIDSRLTANGGDFFLLRMGPTQGTSLRHYLYGQ